MASLIKHANNPKIADQIFNIDYPYTEENAIERLNFVFQALKKENRYVFAIADTHNNELIGEIGIHLDEGNKAEMGYWLSEDYWGKGLMTEAIGAALQFGFNEVGLNKIFATHFLENPASGKAMKKNGMIKEAELKDHYFYNGMYKSVVQYRLTKAEYEAL